MQTNMHPEKKEELLKLLVEFYKDASPSNEHYRNSMIGNRIDALVSEYMSSGETLFDNPEEVNKNPEPLSKDDEEYLDELFGPVLGNVPKEATIKLERGDGKIMDNTSEYLESTKSILLVPEKQTAEIGIELKVDPETYTDKEIDLLYEQSHPKSLTLENFWNPLKKIYPDSMNAFCKWVDEYKKRVNWPELLGSAIKYHDLPIAMQIGIFFQFTFEYRTNLFLVEDVHSMDSLLEAIKGFLNYDQYIINSEKASEEIKGAEFNTSEDLSIYVK